MSEFVLPEDLSTLSAEDLAALETQAVEAFDALYDAGNPDAAALEAMTQLGQAISAIRSEGTARAEAQAEADRQAAEVHASIHGDPASEEGGEDGGDAPADETPAETPEVPAAEPQDPDGGDPTVPEDVTPEAPVAVAASAKIPARPRPTRINIPIDEARARQPKVEKDAMHGVSITAAGDIPGYAPGSKFASMADVAKAMHAKAPLLADGGMAVVGKVDTTRGGTRPTVTGLMDGDQVDEILGQAADPKALVAAGGWCAPSEPLYELFGIEGVDGLLDLPTVTVTRGGITFPTSPSIGDVFASANGPWLWTEANDIAALAGTPTKPCFRIPCPGFNEERLDAHGICITHGNLSDRAYPELTRRWISLFMSAHEHLMSQRFIADIVSQSVIVTGAAVTPAAGDQGFVAPVLGMTELQAVDYRLKYRMSDSAVLETVFPTWAKGMFRADISRRNGYDNPFDVSDEEINSWLDRRGVRAQWVQDWQVGGVAGPGGTSVRQSWPSNLSFLMYAAGTFVRGDGGSIDLGVQRDSTLNATNDHTAAWSEEFHLIAKRGHESRLVTIAVCPDGSTGAQVDYDCPLY